MIEWITGQQTVTATYTEPKWIKRITKIHDERPEEFKRFIVNEDGSVCATFPKKWVKNNPGSTTVNRTRKPMTEEEKKVLVERLTNGRKKKQKEEN